MYTRVLLEFTPHIISENVVLDYLRVKIRSIHFFKKEHAWWRHWKLVLLDLYQIVLIVPVPCPDTFLPLEGMVSFSLGPTLAAMGRRDSHSTDIQGFFRWPLLNPKVLLLIWHLCTFCHTWLRTLHIIDVQFTLDLNYWELSYCTWCPDFR